MQKINTLMSGYSAFNNVSKFSNQLGKAYKEASNRLAHLSSMEEPQVILGNIWKHPEHETLSSKFGATVYHGLACDKAVASMIKQLHENLLYGGEGKLDEQECMARMKDGEPDAALYVTPALKGALDRTGFNYVLKVRLAAEGDLKTDTERQTDYVPVGSKWAIESVDKVENREEFMGTQAAGSVFDIFLGSKMGSVVSTFFDTLRNYNAGEENLEIAGLSSENDSVLPKE